MDASIPPATPDPRPPEHGWVSSHSASSTDQLAHAKWVLTRLACGDRKALAELYTLYGEMVFRFSLSRCGRYADAQDVTQETFITLLGGKGDWAHRFADPRLLLIGIANNKLRHLYRERGRQAKLVSLATQENLSVDLAWPAELSDPAARYIIANEARKRGWSVREVIANLDQDTGIRGQIAVLRYFYNLDYAAIAEALGTTEAYCRQAVRRARLIVVNEFEDPEPVLQHRSKAAEPELPAVMEHRVENPGDPTATPPGGAA